MIMGETRFLMIRHGEHALGMDKIAGRTAGVGLSALGREQAVGIARRLAGVKVDAIYSSPLERTRETALPLAAQAGLPVQVSEALVEVAFGEWTLQAVAHLDTLEHWRKWNAYRSGTRAPGGEMLVEVQARLAAEIQRLRGLHDGQTVALFTHGDCIRALLVHFLGMPMDLLLRLEVGLASISVVRVGEWGVVVEGVNAGGQ